MKRGYFVTGTDTGVGKTLIACGLLRRFALAGLSTVGMKPVAAGCTESEAGLLNEDVEVLRRSSSVQAAREWINPYAFRLAIAPHLAAAAEGLEIKTGSICRSFEKLCTIADAVIVEGIGGFRVPLSAHADSADLAVAIGLPIILVVGMRQGCLNHALLTAEAIERRGLQLRGWVANHIDPHMLQPQANVTALFERLPCPLLGTIPYLLEPDASRLPLRLPE